MYICIYVCVYIYIYMCVCQLTAAGNDHIGNDHIVLVPALFRGDGEAVTPMPMSISK